jgi:hypothetical protein
MLEREGIRIELTYGCTRRCVERDVSGLGI